MQTCWDSTMRYRLPWKYRYKIQLVIRSCNNVTLLFYFYDCLCNEIKKNNENDGCLSSISHVKNFPFGYVILNFFPISFHLESWFVEWTRWGWYDHTNPAQYLSTDVELLGRFIICDNKKMLNYNYHCSWRHQHG